jgi:hypothetical protein
VTPGPAVSSWRKIAWILAVVFLCAGTLALGGCGRAVGPRGSGANLLEGTKPIRSKGVHNAGRLTDGEISQDGDFWNTQMTARVEHTGFVEYDLGEPMPVSNLLIQADNDDRYLVSGSMDGEIYGSLWEAAPVHARGLQQRTADQLGATARYLRIAPAGGDRNYSISEIQAYAERPAQWPPKLVARRGIDVAIDLRSAIVRWGFVCMALLVVLRRGASRWLELSALVPLVLGVALAVDIAEVWPLGERELSLLRAVVAAIAGGALLLEAYAPARWAPDRRVVTGTLSVLAVIAVGCYFHLGHLQFHDQAKERQTLVHPWDMRVYFPVAKYFRELKYDGLYLASVAAYLDDVPDATPQSIATVKLRDLTNNEMRRAAEIMPQITAVKERFSPERWREFTEDMRYFRQTMGGPAYLGSLADHGGNATPVWILAAHLLFRHAPANELTLSLTALFDPLLLVLLSVAVVRTFGWRALLLVLIVFGTTDFSRFGTNLVGSTLRFDWIACLGLGACALKTRRYVLGGATLAYAGLIRAFPALAVAALVLPAGWWLAEQLRKDRRLPSLRAFGESQQALVRSALGAIGCVAIMAAATSAVFSYQNSWGIWFEKIRIHAEKPNANHVGLRTILAHEDDKVARLINKPELAEPWTPWQHAQLDALARRLPLFLAGVATFSLLVVLSCRKKRLDTAALFGLLLVPIFFYPANYYCHYVCLLPLLAAEEAEAAGRRFAWVAGVLLAMCTLQYQTLLERWSDECYYGQSLILVFGFFALLLPYAWETFRELSPVRSSSPAPVASSGVVAEGAAPGDVGDAGALAPAAGDAGADSR